MSDMDVCPGLYVLEFPSKEHGGHAKISYFLLFYAFMVSLNYKICLIGIYPTKSVVHESHTLCRVSSVCHGYLIDSEKSTQCSLKFV